MPPISADGGRQQKCPGTPSGGQAGAPFLGAHVIPRDGQPSTPKTATSRVAASPGTSFANMARVNVAGLAHSLNFATVAHSIQPFSSSSREARAAVDFDVPRTSADLRTGHDRAVLTGAKPPSISTNRRRAGSDSARQAGSGSQRAYTRACGASLRFVAVVMVQWPANSSAVGAEHK